MVASWKARATAMRGGKRLRRHGERGASMVEFGLVVPIFMVVVAGMCSMGFLFNQYLELTEAVNIGGQQLALARGNLSDPCKSVAGYVTGAVPFLSSSNMTFSFTINGTAYNFTKGQTPISCTAGASGATKGGYPVSLSVTYACSGIWAFNIGSLVNFNPLPASSCNIQSQITEISQ
jgi:Flp pilus assembly protein TadG